MGVGEVRQLGTGTTTLTGAANEFGSLTVRAGQVTLDGGTTTLTSTGSRPLLVGRDTPDIPVLVIQNGAQLIANQGTTNLVTGTSGTSVTVDGAKSLWETGQQLVIGRNDFSAGRNFGQVTVQAGATLKNDVNILVGDTAGNGTLLVQTAGQVNTLGAAIIGRDTGSVGTATVTDANSIWTIGGDLRLGGFDSADSGGTATLNVLKGGSVSVVGRAKFWTSGSSITANGGVFSAGSLTNVAGTTPVISISDAGGISALQVGSDNTSSTYSGTIVDALGGAGSMVKSGTGALTLTGANTYSGGTTISGGALFANNTSGSATGSGAVTINASTTLAGNGTAGGAITLNSGGFIAPGATSAGISTATLHGGSLTWNGGSQLNMELGTTSDLLALATTFKKGTGSGFTINVADAGGILNQNQYTLVTFGSNVGFSAADFTLATGIAGLSGTFTMNGTSLDLVLAFAASGSIIQNLPRRSMCRRLPISPSPAK